MQEVLRRIACVFRRFRIVTGISCALFAAAAWQVGSHSSNDFTAEAQTLHSSAATAAQLHPVSASIPVTTKPVSIPAPGNGNIHRQARRSHFKLLLADISAALPT